MAAEYWTPGTEILWRYADGFVEPVRVVRDDADGLVAWSPAGSSGAERDVLRIALTNAWWSVEVLLDAATGAFAGHHVTIEDPHTRTDAGVRSRDHLLGLDVAPDRTRVRTGETELDLAVRQGRYNRDEAELITAVASQAEAVVDAWGSPFCDGWESFRPEPDWPLPRLEATPGSL